MEPTALPARFAELAASRTLPRCTCAAASFVRRAYVINLDHRVHGERFRLMAAQLDRSCLEWELWPGIEPSLATFDALGRLLPSNMRANRSLFNAMVLGDERGRSLLGNYLSHVTLWEHIVRQPAAEGGTGAFLILEDDLWLAPDWQALLSAGHRSLPGGWATLQAAWFGSRFESAAVNALVDAVDRSKFQPDTVARPGSSREAARDDFLQRGNLSNADRRKGTAPYLGLQVVLATARGLGCLLQRVPELGYGERNGRFSIDAQSVRAGCPGRYALRDGFDEPANWENPRLIAWHVSGKHNKIRELQAKVYAKWTPDWHCLGLLSRAAAAGRVGSTQLG